MKFYRIYFLVVCVASVLFSCKKNTTTPTPSPYKEVYVVGNNTFIKEDTSFELTYEKKRHKLFNSYQIFVTANSISVLGNQTLIAGNVDTYQHSNYPMCWLNKKPQILSSFPGEALSAFITTTDQYICGYVEASNTNFGKAVLWKNGIIKYLSSNLSKANAVVVSGNDVYVAIENFLSQSILLKNDSAFTVEGNSSVVKSLYIDGNDVYAAGSVVDSVTYKLKPAYWKNGKLTILSNSEGQAKSIVVNNSKVYVVGWKIINNSTATIWENGVEKILVKDGCMSEANSVCVSKGNVYAVGRKNELLYNGYYFKTDAMLWINSKEADNNSFMGNYSSIFVPE